MPSKRQLRFEVLEERQVLTTLGVPWPAPQRLTLSFAPDGTRVGLFESDLYSLLGTHRTAEQWQTQVLRAFQTWVAEADIEIRLAPDGGQAFGAAGLAQGDPRFGDIRLAAFPQQRALANAVPYLPIAGSWSGDVFLNSAAEAGLKDPRVDLFTVLLNEAGNVLGLADNVDPASAMYTDYIGPRTGLADSDADAIRDLYGSRHPDSWEGQAGNDTVESAAALGSASSLAGAASLTIDAELSTIGDADYYHFDTPDAVGIVTVRVRASGHSLLVPRVSMLDEAGNIVASAAAENALDNDVQVSIHRSNTNASYLVRVDGATSDVFAVGRYELQIISRMPGTIAVPAGAPSSPDASISAWGYVDEEVSENNTPATATALMTPWGYEPATRYEAVGAVRTTTDVDVYRVVSPPDEASMLLVNVETLGTHPISVQVEVRTAPGDLVDSRTIINADGTQPIEIDNLSPNEAYFVSVASDGRGRDVGNYVLIADFVVRDPAVELIASGTLSSAEPYQNRHFVIPRTQLFRFDLSADAATDGDDGQIELTIVDEQERTIAVTSDGDNRTQRLYVWLTTGTYQFRFLRQSTTSNSLRYELRGAALSDDTGPGWIDPTEAPLPGDADRNGTVDRGDVRVVASQFTQFSDALFNTADFDADGDVDLADLAVIMWNLGRSLIPVSTGQPLPSWASAAVAIASGHDNRNARVLRASPTQRDAKLIEWEVPRVDVVLHASVARGHRLQTVHRSPALEAPSDIRLPAARRRLAAVDLVLARGSLTSLDQRANWP